MFGFNNGINEYKRVGIETGVESATPQRLVVMLYEGAILACHEAIAHMQKKAFEQKGIALTQAISIIENGLRISLDKKVGGEMAENLDALYQYMTSRLYLASVKNQAEIVFEVINLLNQLKSAWESIESTTVPEAPGKSAPAINLAMNTARYSQQSLILG